jgi:outer membrane protein assembly factor BamB
LRADRAGIPRRGGVANLVVADLDRAGAPARAELLRVLAPGGALWLRRAGAWGIERPPRPEGLDDWTHEYRGPDQNPVSRDTRADLPRGMQWLAGYGRSWGDPRIGGGAFVSVDSPLKFGKTAKPARPIASHLVVRDASNGVPLWAAPVALHQQQPAIIADGRVFWFPEPGKPMRSAGLRTGADAVVYDQGATWTVLTKRINNPDLAAWAFVSDRKLIQAWHKQVAALDPATGKVLWRWQTEEPFVNALAGGHDGQVYVGTGANPWATVRFFGSREAKEVVALGAEDGKARWKAPVPEGQIGQIVPIPGRVVLVSSAHHRWNTDIGYVAVLDAKSGARLWISGFAKGRGNDAIEPPANRDALGSNVLVFGGKVVMCSSYATTVFDLADGKAAVYDTGVNQGCQRVFGLPEGRLLLATAPTVLSGVAGDLSKLAWRQNGMLHAGCAEGIVPAQGLVYSRSSTFCDCAYQLRVNQCWSPAVAAEARTPDDKRLSKLEPAQPAPPPPGAFAPPAGPLGMDWENGSYGPAGVSAGPEGSNIPSPHVAVPVFIAADGTGPAAAAGDLTIAPVVHHHRVAARRGGAAVWSFQLDGRAAAAPLVKDGAVYVAGRDGWLYALDAQGGRMRWKFLAARADLRLVNSGQIESVWPCVGVAAHQDLIWTAAGFSPELDGGIQVWGLDKDGAIRRAITVTEPEGTGGVAESKGVYRLKIAKGHTGYRGGGFQAQRLAVQDGRLCLGYRRTKNFGSHPGPAWVYLPIDTGRDGAQPLGGRDGLIVVPDEPKPEEAKGGKR